jgi:hypothetical protein
MGVGFTWVWFGGNMGITNYRLENFSNDDFLFMAFL